MPDAVDYRTELDPEGKIVRVFRVTDGSEEEVHIDAASQKFADFVTWAAARGRSIGHGYQHLKEGERCFADYEELMRYCRENNICIAVESISEEGHIRFAGYDGTQDQSDRAVLRHSPSATVANRLMYPNDIAFSRLNAVGGIWEVAGKSSPSTLIYGRPLSLRVSHTLENQLIAELVDEDSDARKLSSLPVQRSFVYFDVSDFSQEHPLNQLRIINQLITTVHDDHLWPDFPWARTARLSREADLCIGDGYIFVFTKPLSAVWFAGFLAHILERHVKKPDWVEFHFRMSVHTDEVYRFWDRSSRDSGRWNFIGKGITGAERVLSAAGKEKDDIVYVSAETRQQIMLQGNDDASILTCLHNRGRQKDKHGGIWRIYELNHSDWIDRVFHPVLRIEGH